MKKLTILLAILAIKENALFAMQRTSKRQCLQSSRIREVLPQKFERTDNSNNSFRINLLSEDKSNTKRAAFTEDYKEAIKNTKKSKN